jgi:hypothetical protein
MTKMNDGLTNQVQNLSKLMNIQTHRKHGGRKIQLLQNEILRLANFNGMVENPGSG